MSEQTTLTLTDAEKTLVAQLNDIGAKQAASDLSVSGLPTRRVEAYHYTDLRTLLRDVPALSTEGEHATPSSFKIANAYEINLENGHASSVNGSPTGVFVADQDGSNFGEQDDILSSLNRAFTRKSLLVRLEGRVENIIHLKRSISGDACHVNSAVVFDVAAGAEVVVLETFEGSDAAHLGNHTSWVNLGAGAKFTHVVVDAASRKARHFHTIEYTIGENVQLRNLVVNSGAGLSRVQMFGRFEGEGAHANLSGLNLVDEAQHCDITMDMTHAVENTSAEELFKSVVRNRARAVFQGRILVDAVAQKTDAKMMAQGLMLSEGAQILSKPELEIFADDVQCGHGCTCGELDEDALFYLMSRGIGREEAGALLIRAFIQELLDPIENQDLNDALSGIVSKWLDGGTSS